MDHDAAVLQRPARPAGALVADEPILDAQTIIGILVLGKQVAELIVELGIMVIDDFENAVFDPKGVAEIVARVVAFDLGLPAVQILAVEERDPALRRRQVLCSSQKASGRERTEERRQSREAAIVSRGAVWVNRKIGVIVAFIGGFLL